MSKINRVRLSELSEKALDNTIDKYTWVMMKRGQLWSYCLICVEIDVVAGKEKILNQNRCKHLCPLYPSDWCQNTASDSRLYNPSDEDMTNYLWWITTELELRRTEYERNLGGAW